MRIVALAAISVLCPSWALAQVDHDEKLNPLARALSISSQPPLFGAELAQRILSCPPSAGAMKMGLPKGGNQTVEGKTVPSPDLAIRSDYRSSSGRHKVLLRGASHSALKRIGIDRIFDYDSFQVVDAEAQQLSALKSLSAAEPEYLDYQNLIQIGQRLIDTTDASAKASANQVSETGQWIVQFAGPIKDEWYAAMQATGARIVNYLPSNAYVLSGDAKELARVQRFAREASYVQWQGPVLIEDKLTLGAVEHLKSLRPGVPAPTGIYTIQILTNSPMNSQTRALLSSNSNGRVINEYEILDFTNITLPLSVDSLREIAARPDVVVVEPYIAPTKLDERQNMIVAGNITGNGPTPGDYFSLLSTWGFNQAQFTTSNFGVDVSDSGIDNATTTPNHFGLRLAGAIGGTSRVVYNRLEGTANVGSTLQGCDGHGNLNAHIIGGHTGSRTAAPHADAQGFRYGLGVNPFINRIGSSVIFDPSTFTNPNLPNLQSRAYNDQMRLSSNSWGSAANGAYTTTSQTFDALTRDAQPTGSTFANAGNQQMVVLFAAGNSGPGVDTMGAPGTAKNVITVGASENVHPFGAADQCGTTDSGADNLNDIIAFSSRGPTDDGRVKPDIVAPGTHVSGGVFQATHSDAGNGAAAACFDASGVCAGPGASDFWPLGQQFYTASSGTSHSTPAVAGGASLVYQQFLNNPTYLSDRLPAGAQPPSPAMVKAYLTNTTRYMTGVSANDNLYSNNQGMGLMDLGRAFDTTPRIIRDQVAAQAFANTGELRVFTGSVSDASRPFRVSLAWTDAPGATTGNSFSNNLDLTVTIAGQTYRGNVFSGALSVPGGSADIANNLESVFLPAGFPVGTPFLVTVRATNITANGIPNDGAADPTDQDFALVVYNGATASLPVIQGTATIVGGTCPANGTAPDPGETLEVSIALQNIGTANTGNLNVQLLNQSGVTLASGTPVNYGTLVAGGASVARAHGLRVDPALVCGNSFTPIVRMNDGGAVVNQDQSLNTQITGVANIPLAENFDGVVAPALPAGWTASLPLGSGPTWTTTTTLPSDSGTNKIFTPNPATPSDSRIDSPSVAIPAGPTASVLVFRHRFLAENRFDGGVLEISIGGGAFADIITSGGTFVAGGYTNTLRADLSTTNPLAGRSAWTGTQAAFGTVQVTLPLSANGQNIVLRWRFGTDNLVNATGWFVDSIQISSGRTCVLGCQGTTMSINDVSVSEGNSSTTSMTYTVTRSNPLLTQSVSAQTIAGGTATAPVDFTAVGPTTLTFSGVQTTQSFTVSVNGDTDVETNETVFAQLSAITGGVALSDPDGIGTILNDDNAIATTTTITSDTPDPSAPGQAYTVSVTVASASASPTGSVTISDGTSSCGPVVLVAGPAPTSTASCNLTSNTVGNLTLTATYAPSGSFLGSNDTEPHEVAAAPGGGDVSVTLTDAPDPVAPGGSLTYVATLTSNGPGSANNASVSLPLPGTTTLISATADNGGSCSGLPVVCTWAGATPSGANRIATIVVRVPATATGTLNATVTAAASNDGNAGNNQANATTNISRRRVVPGG